VTKEKVMYYLMRLCKVDITEIKHMINAKPVVYKIIAAIL